MSLWSKLFGSNEKTESLSVPPTRVPEGGIFIRNGSLEEIQNAVEEHANLFPPQKPAMFPVKVSQLSSGSAIIEFPGGVTAYGLVNLIGWLNSPPGKGAVSGAFGWIVSPVTDIRYVLTPESENPAGDTLTGLSSEGKYVRVYQPEARMSEMSSLAQIPEFPMFEEADVQQSIEFSITLDAVTNFGNPGFVITDSKDKQWGDHNSFPL